MGLSEKIADTRNQRIRASKRVSVFPVARPLRPFFEKNRKNMGNNTSLSNVNISRSAKPWAPVTCDANSFEPKKGLKKGHSM